MKIWKETRVCSVTQHSKGPVRRVCKKRKNHLCDYQKHARWKSLHRDVSAWTKPQDLQRSVPSQNVAREVSKKGGNTTLKEREISEEACVYVLHLLQNTGLSESAEVVWSRTLLKQCACAIRQKKTQPRKSVSDSIVTSQLIELWSYYTCQQVWVGQGLYHVFPCLVVCQVSPHT